MSSSSDSFWRVGFGIFGLAVASSVLPVPFGDSHAAAAEEPALPSAEPPAASGRIPAAFLTDSATAPFQTLAVLALVLPHCQTSRQLVYMLCLFSWYLSSGVVSLTE